MRPAQAPLLVAHLLAVLCACSPAAVGVAASQGGDATPPQAPSNFVASAQSSSAIQLTWTDSATDETGFSLERSLSSSSGFAEVASPLANATTCTDTGLSPSTTYYYRLRAANGAGSSDFTPVASATTWGAAAAPPAAPSNLAATAQSSSTIQLSWTDNATDEEHFEVHRSLSASTGFTQVGSPAADATAWSDSGLNAGTQYHYRVRAVNAAGSSDFTPVASATTQGAAPAAPAAPSNLAATAQSSSSIRLSWTDNATDETSFNVERSLSSSSGFAEVATPLANATSYTDAALSPSTTYHYRLRAVNAAGASAYTTVASATTQAATPPPADLAAALAVLAQHAVFFDHASVGKNIMDGLDTLLASNTGPKPTRVAFDSLAVVASRVNNGTFADSYFVADNGYPLQKMAEFRDTDLGTSGLGTKLDGLGGVAVMKLCFADFNSPGLTTTDAVDAAFTTYETMVSGLTAAFPGLKLVHMTAALRSDGNALRERFNDRIRSTYGASGRVFDLADIEDGGTHNLQTGRARVFQTYNDGSDHLTTAGKAAVARALVLFLAGLF